MDNNIIKALCVIVLIMGISGCGVNLPQYRVESQHGALYDSPPEDYSLGWEHGCQSAFATYSNLDKSKHVYKQDANLMHNVLYFKAWKDSFNYCRTYISGFTEVPDGSPEFQKGWEDGCKNTMHKYDRRRAVNNHKVQQNVNMSNDGNYDRGWKNASTYCRWYQWQWSRQADKK